MAKASPTSKSQQIKQALLDNPDKGPSEVAEILKAKGVDVTNAYVSVVKSTMKKKGRKARRTGRVSGVAQPVAKGHGGVNSVEAAVDFVSSVGSFEEARAAIERLQTISRLFGTR